MLRPVVQPLGRFGHWRLPRPSVSSFFSVAASLYLYHRIAKALCVEIVLVALVLLPRYYFLMLSHSSAQPVGLL